jgi:phage terminase small subunit
VSLTERQKRFVRAYRETANATESARRAGYSGNDATLGVTGSRMLKNAKVAEELAKADGKAERHHLERREARSLLLAQIANGEVDDFEETTVRSEEGSERVVQPARARLRERLKALELLGKMGGDFIEKREVSGPGGGPQQVDANVSVEGLVRIARTKKEG